MASMVFGFWYGNFIVPRFILYSIHCPQCFYSSENFPLEHKSVLVVGQICALHYVTIDRVQALFGCFFGIPLGGVTWIDNH